MDAGDLQAGDILMLRDGRQVEIQEIRIAPACQPVYNFSVAELSCYAVGPMQVLVHNNCKPEGASAPINSNDVLVRRGSSRESAQRLARQAEAAEQAGKSQNGVSFGHGVSVTTPASNIRLSKNPRDVALAQRKALQEAGFEVRHTPTRSDPNHHTVQLPKPVTDEVANLFNHLFGRGR